MPVWLIGLAIGLSVVSFIASIFMMTKRQKQKRPAADQTDGSLADYGVKTSRISGTVWIHPNNIDAHTPTSKAIKKKAGGKK